MAVGTSQFSSHEALGQAELFEEVLSQVVLWGPHLAQVGQILAHLLQNLDLLIQTALLQEVAEVGVAFSFGQFVQVQQALIDGHLHVEGVLHSLDAPMPTVAVSSRDVTKVDAASTLILQDHEHLGTGLVVV